jgi:general secretion pathway protein F
LRFDLRIFDIELAQVTSRTLDAPDLPAARALAAAMGGAVLSVRPLDGARNHAVRLDVAPWCRELRTLLDAGMTVVEALETLRAQASDPARARLHSDLLDTLHQGLALSETMRRSAVFPQMLIAGVKAGERTSALVGALDDYLRHHDLLAALRRRAVSAAIYPTMVLALGVAIAGFLLVVVAPSFAVLYAEQPAAVSGITGVVLAASRLLSEHRPAMAGVMASMLMDAAWAWHGGWHVRFGSMLLDSIGPLQRRLDEYRLAMLYQSLALMFRGGFAIDEALTQCGSLALGRRLDAGIAAARTAVLSGGRVSEAFGAAGLADDVSRRLLAVGERSGNFDRVLQAIAQRHAERFETLVERATRVIEPLMLLGVALLVGGLVLLLYMPIFDIAGSLG